MLRALPLKHRVIQPIKWSVSARKQSTKPYYVSTPIFYVNAVPHVGHLYTSVIGDVITRYAKLRSGGGTTFFNTGTDEHGLKIQRAAQAAGMEPKAFCDQISTRFKDLASAADVKYDRFMRTTDADHILAAQHFWRQLQESGHLFKGEHSGWYSISDECFYTDSQICPAPDLTPSTSSPDSDNAPRMVSIETGSVVEWTKEENYKFRLGAFREPLIRWLQENPKSVQPPSRRTELLEYLSDPSSMPDLSISRPRKRLQWGIPVPGDDEHTIYVWLEALVNYLTATGYPWSGSTPPVGNPWPTDVHVVGKDITRFHAVLFPSFLLALGIPLPKTILAHGHWTMDRMKMSKSRGNVADPFVAIDTYGVDSVRYFLMRAGGNFKADADWSEDQIRTVYNHDLRNTLGNLVARVLSSKLNQVLGDSALVDSAKTEGLSYSALVRDTENRYDSEDGEIKKSLETLRDDVDTLLVNFEYGKALERVQQCLMRTNEHTTQLAWWKHVPRKQLPNQTSLLDSLEPQARANAIAAVKRTHIYTHEALRICGILLQPFMPSKSREILDGLGVSDEDRRWDRAVLDLDRIDKDLAYELPGYRVGWVGLFPRIEEAEDLRNKAKRS